MKVFEEQFNDQTQRYMTKIVLATKIAESSVTINGVTVVIDTGLAKEASYDPVRKITTIDTELISKAQAVQRRGRAGRTSEGICYRAYSEDEYNSMEAGKLPEIKKTNSDMILLKILGLGANIEEFELIDKLDPVVVS
jgi:HrpA-like RNA helicase